MKASKRSRLGVIFFTIFINMVGFGVVIPVLPFYASHFGASPLQIGWLFGIFSLAQFLFAPLFGQLSDRFGRRPVLILSTLGTAAGFFVMGFGQTLTMLFVGRVIDGISGGSIGTAQAYVADITGPEDRSRAMGLIGAAFGLGFIFGPAIGGWTSAQYGHAAPMLLAGALALVNAGLIFFLLPESLSRDTRRALPKEPLFPGLFRHIRPSAYLASVATYFTLIVGFSMMTAVFALFVAKRHGFDEKDTGYLFAMLGLIGAVIQGGLIGRIVKRFGEARTATAGAVLMMAGLFSAPLAPGLAALLIACALMAVGNSLINPTLPAIASQSADAEWQGRALGVLQSCGSLARWIGPVAGGWLLQFDLARATENYAITPLWAAAAVLGAAAVISLRLPAGKKTPPVLDRA
jgi:MFS transporter, DHA1 family, tetracycline resistance protein